MSQGKSDGVTDDEIRIVLIGKTGSGKSETCNTILGRPGYFDCSPLASSVTKECKRGEVKGKRFGKKLMVVDTPGLFDTDMDNEFITKEITKCIGMISPGPNAFLLVIRIGKFTIEEQNTVKELADLFGEQIYKFLVVLFTWKDALEGYSIDQFLSNSPENLQQILQKCGKRYIAFDNTASQETKEKDLKQLVDMIEDMVRQNRGTCYTIEMYRQAELAVRRDEDTNYKLASKRKDTKRTKIKDNASEYKQKEEEYTETLRAMEKHTLMSKVKTDSVNDEEIRIILIGKSGSGMSSTGNTILSRQGHFKNYLSVNSVTMQSERGETFRFGKRIIVVDTPGLFNTFMENKDIIQEITRSITIASPGPHAIVLVNPVGRFTGEEKDTIKYFAYTFGPNMFNYLIVLFTRSHDLEGLSIDHYVSENVPFLKNTVQKCGQRYIGFDNRASQETKEKDSKQLLDMIIDMVHQNGGSYYTSEMYRLAQLPFGKEH